MNYASWRKSLFIYLGLSLLSFLLIISSNNRVVLFFKDVENTVFYPFRFVLRTATGKIVGMTQALRNQEDTETQIERLKAEVETYKQAVINLNAVQEDNNRLKQILDLRKNLEYDGIVADVIGRDFAYGYSYITINKGRIDGVAKNFPVIAFVGTSKAVVGIVIEANLMTSKVQTLKSELSNIGAYLPRTGSHSVVEGLGGGARDIQLLYVDKSENVERGDIIYTSSDSQFFPPNILIGTINGIDNTKKNIDNIPSLCNTGSPFKQSERSVCPSLSRRKKGRIDMTRPVWIYSFIGFALFLFSMETPSIMEIHSHIPDIMLIFIVFIAQKYGVLPGILAGFFSGLFIDFFSGQLLGAQAFAKMTVGLIAGLIGSRLIVYSFQTGILVTLISACIQSIIFYVEILLFSHLSSLEYFRGIWISILYTFLVSPILIAILGFIDSKISRRF